MMPVAKGAALYAPIAQEELLATCSDGVAVGLRRRWACMPCVRKAASAIASGRCEFRRRSYLM
jgi:hypothetical protein